MSPQSLARVLGSPWHCWVNIHPFCRAVAFTVLNAQSSRSHGIVMLTIMKRPSSTPKNRAIGQKVKIGRLFMVDLAGSERLKKSRSTGECPISGFRVYKDELFPVAGRELHAVEEIGTAAASGGDVNITHVHSSLRRFSEDDALLEPKAPCL